MGKENETEGKEELELKEALRSSVPSPALLLCHCRGLTMMEQVQ